MNVFAELFGIFRQRGLVNTVKENRPLTGFIAAATILSVTGAALYGFAMGIGLGIETSIKDAVKAGLIAILSLAFAVPIFLLAYRLLGREERPGQVAAVPVTLLVTVVIILLASAPVAFLLSVLASSSPDAIYIHIVIVDVALLVGLYVSGTLVYHALPAERGRLTVPNVLGFALMAVVLIVLIAFFRPFLAPWPSFSVGTDRLKDGLGIGVAEKVERALAAAAAANRVSYHFQMTNANGDPERDYTITRVADDHLVQIRVHAVPGGPIRKDRNIWLLNNSAYADFDDGRVLQHSQAELEPFLAPALSPGAFRLPDAFAHASWRAWESAGVYVAAGTAPDGRHTKVVLDVHTGRLRELTLDSAVSGLRAQTRVSGIDHAFLDAAGIEASLNRATVLGSVDRSDAALETYVQSEVFFAVRYPRSWQVGAWDAVKRCVTFASDCSADQPCPVLQVSAYDLVEGKSAQQYADDLARSLWLDPAYREVRAGPKTVDGKSAGLVEYLFDRTEKGEIKTTRHAEYIFVGRMHRYHLDFTAPDARFDAHKDLFAVVASLFVFLT